MEIRIAANAEEDIENARQYLLRENPAFGERFHADLIGTLHYVLRFPRGFQLRHGHYRYAPLGIFRYVIIYSIEGAFIVVHRVRHMHRKDF